MVSTRMQQATRMVRDVFGNGAGSSLELALVENNMMDVLVWLSVDDSVFKELEYADASNKNNPKRLKYGDYHKIRVLRAMVFYMRANGEDDMYDATDITQDEFNQFMSSSECIRIMISSAPVPNLNTAPNVVVSTVQAELATFRKGIKRDAAIYPIITQDAQWDAWNRSIVSIARAQSVEQVLDSKFKPVLQEEVLLFSEKQKFMYAVFERTIQTDKGKALYARTKPNSTYKRCTRKCMIIALKVLRHS
jgi:hypothetical protein